MSGPTQGIFIVVDGIDGAGKTTQVQILADALEKSGESVVTSKEPTSGAFGRKVRESATLGRLSLDDELRAFVEDRKEHVGNLIAPALAAGSIVILDRYYYSTIAYQGSRGASWRSIAGDMRQMFPTPDVTFLLDADPAVTLHRIASVRGDIPNEFERLDQLTAVRGVFQELAAIYPEVLTIDASQSIPLVYRAITGLLVDGVLKQKRCFKPYDCDTMFCTPRLTGQCEWANMAPKLAAY
jgi:dTMP kinase